MPGNILHSPREGGSQGERNPTLNWGFGRRPGVGDTVLCSLRSRSIKAMSEVRACMSEGLSMEVSRNSPCVLMVDEHNQI